MPVNDDLLARLDAAAIAETYPPHALYAEAAAALRAALAATMPGADEDPIGSAVRRLRRGESTAGPDHVLQPAEPTWNKWLRYYAGLRGGVFVDWAGYSAAHPEWFVADQLHMTITGQAAYRRAITEGVQQCP